MEVQFPSSHHQVGLSLPTIPGVQTFLSRIYLALLKLISPSQFREEVQLSSTGIVQDETMYVSSDAADSYWKGKLMRWDGVAYFTSHLLWFSL